MRSIPLPLSGRPILGGLGGGLPEDDRAALKALVLLGGFFFVAVAAAYGLTLSWSEPIPRDATSLVVGRDYLNFWMYGQAAAAADPGRFYDPALYNEALRALLGPNYFGQNWSYPPSLMLIAAPFGQLPYLAGLFIWTALGLTAFLLVARSALSDTRVLIALVFSPAAVFCVISGQSSLLSAAIFIAIFACLDTRPVVAGILIGCLSLKPQLGLLFPVLLMASGRWRTFASATATTIALAAATALLFGPQVWIDFAQKGLLIQNGVMADDRLLLAPFMPTLYMNLREAGAGYALAMAVQALLALLALFAVLWAYRFRRKADPHLLAALFLACSVAAVPYLLSYDTLPLACVAVMLLATGKLDGMGRRLVQLVYWLPLIQMVLGTLHVPGPALIAPAFAVYVLMRLHAASESHAHEPPAAVSALRT